MSSSSSEVAVVTSSLGALETILEQLRLRTQQDLQKDVLDMKGELENALDQVKEILRRGDPSIMEKCWVEEVREFSYDADNYLDTVWRSSRTFSLVNLSRIVLEWRGPHLIPGLKMYISHPKMKKQRKRALLSASEISRRLQDAEERRTRYQPERNEVTIIISDDDSMLAGPSSDTTQFSEPKPVDETADWKQASNFSHLHGLAVSMLALDTERQLKVISIFGPAGVGKTTLASKLYDDYGGRFHCRAFNRMSRNNPDARGLLTSVLSRIKGRHYIGSGDMQSLIDNVHRHLQGKSYFFIIEDLWTESVWDIIKHAFPEGNCYSRIIITTEIMDVAVACCSDFTKCMVDTRSLCSAQTGKIFSSNIECAKKDIMQKYNDLTSQLKTCLLYLHMYPEDYLFSKDDLVKQWLAEGFLGAIDWPYDNDNISRHHYEYLVETGVTYFDELLACEMIQTVKTSHNKRVLFCQVNHIVSELIAQECMDNNFVTVVEYPGIVTGRPDKVRRLSIKFGDAKRAKIPESFRISPLRSFLFSGFFKCLPTIVEYWFLRVLILHIWSDKEKTIMDLGIIGELIQLRYLKIECNMVIIKLPAMIGRLQKLQTMQVYATVAEFPTDMSCLQHLLHLRLPSKVYLPHGTGHGTLHRILDHVNLRTNSESSQVSQAVRAECPLLFHLLCGNDMPYRIGRLTTLRSLRNINLSTCSRYFMLDLGKLNNLQDLHLTCSVGPYSHILKNIMCLANILSKLSKLKSLVLDGEVSSGMSISCDALSTEPLPVNLERLEFCPQIFIMSRLPQWIKHLKEKLCTLKIAVKTLSNYDVEVLKELTHLAALTLYIRTSPEERLIFNTGFRALKYFKLVCPTPRLKFEQGTMPAVRILKLGFNANTMRQYEQEDVGIEHLADLAVISARIGAAGTDEASRAATKHMLVEAFSKHPSNPIINVQFVYWSFHDDTESTSSDVIQFGGTEGQYEIGDTGLTEDTNRLSDSRISLRTESYSRIQNPDWERWRPRNGVGLAEIMRGFSYAIRKHMKLGGFSVKNEIASIKLEMELMTVVLDSSPGDIVLEEWVLQVQNLAYDIEDFIDTYNMLRISRSWRHALAHMSHIVQLKGRIRSLRQWQQSGVPVHGAGGASASLKSPSSGIYASDDMLVGIDVATSEVLKMVLNEYSEKKEQLRVISIVGYRGIGKTSLARAVYDRSRSYNSHEFNSFAWVRASGSRSARDLLNRVNLEFGPLRNYEEAYNLGFLKSNLCKNRTLVVIDDLQRAELWYDIQNALAGSISRSRIILTTSTHSVAAACSPENYIYRMHRLDYSESEKLFWKRVGLRANPTPALQYVLEDTLRKCSGLPLAVISAANYFLRKGPNLPPGAAGAFEEMNVVLSQCYDSLPDNGHRACLLSLITFPKGHLIRKKSLLRRWIAEGLVVGNGGLSAEEVAGNRFNELIDRNIIEPVLFASNSSVKGCLVLGVIKDFIVNKSASKEFAMLIHNDECILRNKNSSHPTRRLSIHGGTKESGRVAEGMRLDRVRSLTICNGVPFTVEGSWLLRVLDLGGCRGVDKKVLLSICKLMFLKYLSLRDSDADRIPKEIKKLERLETLDIRNTQVDTLPIEVFMLPRLAYLFGQFALPRQINAQAARSKLQTFFSEQSRIQTLSGFVMQVENNGLEHILLKMRLLKKVKIMCKRWVIFSYQEQLLTSSLQKCLTGSNTLDSLSIDFGNESINFLNNIAAPYALVSSMKLRGKLISLPTFISSHETTLSELQLSSTGLTIESLSLLQNLHRLLYLKLTDDGDSFFGECFVVQDGGFPSLLSLCFQAPKLPQVHVYEGGMRSLTYLGLLCPEFVSSKNSGSKESHMETYSEKHLEEVFSVDSPGSPMVSSSEIIEDIQEDDSFKFIKEIKRSEKRSTSINIGEGSRLIGTEEIENKFELNMQFKGIEHLKRLNELVLHPSVGYDVIESWKEGLRSHINCPKVSTRLTP